MTRIITKAPKTCSKIEEDDDCLLSSFTWVVSDWIFWDSSVDKCCLSFD